MLTSSSSWRTLRCVQPRSDPPTPPVQADCGPFERGQSAGERVGAHVQRGVSEASHRGSPHITWALGDSVNSIDLAGPSSLQWFITAANILCLSEKW